MRTSIATRATTAVGIGALLLAGISTAFAAPAAATSSAMPLSVSESSDDNEPVMVGSTRGRNVVNRSSHTFKFVGFRDTAEQEKSESNPAIGTLLRPGETHNFQVVWRLGFVNAIHPIYELQDFHVDEKSEAVVTRPYVIELTDGIAWSTYCRSNNFRFECSRIDDGKTVELRDRT